MKRHLKLILLSTATLLLLLAGTNTAMAATDPLASPNNPVGIHVLNETDLTDAANLVNSTGGDWGYVTLVIRKDERDTLRWQRVFNEMRRLHLIPIVRIATRQENGGWQKFNHDEIDGWVSFLDSLNWVIKNRYVIIGNEVNHAKEWGGKVNPEEYAKYFVKISKRLKENSSDFYILPAGLDASAPTNGNYMDENLFLRKVIEAEPDFFDYADGWNSHSYPNPNFSGSENDTGRGTVRTYVWERELLNNIGVEKKLPIFITETGWVHNLGGQEINNKTEDEVGESLIKAYKKAWNDSSIVAITPFVLNYKDEPFNVFSWKKEDGSFYSFYDAVRAMPKKAGSPEQYTKGKVVKILLPPIIKKGDYFYGIAVFRNTGQTIWKRYQSTILERNAFKIALDPPVFSEVEPGHVGLFMFRVVR